MGALLWLVASLSRPWWREGAASCYGRSAWRGGGGLVLWQWCSLPFSLCWFLGGSSSPEIGGARCPARVWELLSSNLQRLAPSPRSDQKVVGLPLSWLHSVRTGALSLPRHKWLVPRWCGDGRSSETSSVFLEKNWRTGSHFFAGFGVFCALLLDLFVISYFLKLLFVIVHRQGY
jgi:hypothetical protein